MDVVLGRLIRALKVGGPMYASFRYGNQEAVRNDRFFNDYDEPKFQALLAPSRARALPPLSPPSLPTATAAAFFFLVAILHSCQKQAPQGSQSRPEEAVRLWTASRRAEMPEGTIVRCELLGVSAAT
jgi:hypothetical protein